MASIPSSRFDITGASGSQGLLGPKDSWRAYVLERGGNASADSTGTLITFDSAAIASRFAVSDWIQAGLLTANIRQVGSVGGNSINVSGAALTVSENMRIFICGVTQPTLMGNSATYHPSTTIRQRGDDSADTFSNSMVTTNSDGLVQFYAAPQMYDVIVQDGNQSNQGYIADLEVGTVEGVSVIDAAYFGSTVTFSGNQVGISSSGVAVFGATVTMHAALGVTDAVTIGSTLTVGTTALINTLYLRSATAALIGTAEPTLYSDITRGLTAGFPGGGKTVQSAVIMSRFTGSTATTDLSLNGMYVINRYGADSVGGGDVGTGIAVGAYSEYRGGSDVTGNIYGAENATTMYNAGSIVNAFGSLNTAQITTGATASITTAYGAYGVARTHGSGQGTISQAVGVQGVAGMQNTSGGTITDAIAGRFSISRDAGVTGRIVNAYGIHIPTVTGASTNNFGLRIQGATGGQNINQSLRVDSGEASFLGSVSFAGVSNSNLTQAATLNLPDGCFFGVSGTIGAGTSISQMTLMTGREILLWAAVGTMGFSRSNNLVIVGASFNVPQGSAVKCFCTGQTWFVISPSS